MKVLIINGSPRKNGCTAAILKAVQEGIPEGHQVDWIEISDLTIKPCVGCGKCRETWECVMPEDDGQRIGKLIKEADALVIGSATFWGNMTGQLKVLFDRNVPAFVKLQPDKMPEQMQKGKPAILAAACAAPWVVSSIMGFGTAATLHQLSKVVNAGGYKIIGQLEQSGTATSQEILPATKKRAQRLGRRLVS